MEDFGPIMAVREQSELFLWNTDYLTERLSLPGGLAQYVGELLVQFYYMPWVGGVIYALLAIAMARVVWLLTKMRWAAGVAAVAVIALAFCLYVPLTLTVAVLMSLTLRLLLPEDKKARLVALAIVIPAGYWLIGPAIVLNLPTPSRGGAYRKEIMATAGYGVLLAVCIFGSWFVTPYPLGQVARGIDYYWEVHPLGTAEERRCDWLVRQKRWGDVVEEFPDASSPAVRNAVALALFQTRQIGEQQLREHLDLSRQAVRSQSSAFLMSEVFMQLGMVQMAQHAAFEAMESTPNYNKSARALRRLTETNLVTGSDRVALKYISLLEETAFYRRFTLQVRPLAEHPEQIDGDPKYGPLKKVFQDSHDTFFH